MPSIFQAMQVTLQLKWSLILRSGGSLSIPTKGASTPVLWYSAESSLEEMEVLTPLRGECSQMHQGWFADPMCSTKRRSTLSDRT